MNRRTRPIGMILLCVVLAGNESAGQTPSSTTLPSVALPPTNILLPNYNGVPIGEVGGLEGGAFLARASDSSAVFYNPAGLTRAKQTSVSGSAGVFQFGGVSAEGLDESARTFQQVPAMFAFVLKDLAGRSNLAGGLSVARTSAWKNTVDFARTAPVGTATDRLSYSSEARLDEWLASVGVGYDSGHRWRGGFSVDLQYTSTDRRQSVANQYLSTDLTAISITSRSEASATHLRFTAGGQYELTSELIVGAVIRARGIGLWTGGLAMLEGVSSTSSATSAASFFDDGGDVTIKVPFEFKTGIAYVRPRGQVELDLLVYTGSGGYQAFVSDRPVTVVDATAGSTPTVVEYPASPPVIDTNAVANIAVGGHYNVTADGTWVVHGGYGTDRSPVGPLDTVFTKVHLRRITVGVSGRTSHFLGSLGVHFVTGESEPVPLRELPSGQLTTTFGVRSVGVVYSLSVLF